MLILSTIDVWRGERSERRSTTKAAATGQARPTLVTLLSGGELTVYIRDLVDTCDHVSRSMHSALNSVLGMAVASLR